LIENKKNQGKAFSRLCHHQSIFIQNLFVSPYFSNIFLIPGLVNGRALFIVYHHRMKSSQQH